MKTKASMLIALIGLLLGACEDESGIAPNAELFTVNVHARMPGVYGLGNTGERVDGVRIKIYPTQHDYQFDKNVLLEGLTDGEGIFTFEHSWGDTLWYGAYLDTLSNQRGVTSINEYSGIRHNEIIILPQPENSFTGGHFFATLTNTSTKLRLSVYDEGQAVEGAQVQLYFTEQAYQDSLAAQEDFVQLRPTYGYQSDDPDLMDPEGSFIYRIEDYFLQTTNEAGEVYFDNLEPRNYWFRITKDTLSNKETTIRTLRALPRTDITNIIEVGIE